MATLHDLQLRLWKLYRDKEASGYDGGYKMSDGAVYVSYPPAIDNIPIDKYVEPACICINSYAFGPSRRHYIYKSQHLNTSCPDTWYGPDIFDLAVKMVDSWDKESNPHCSPGSEATPVQPLVGQTESRETKQ